MSKIPRNGIVEGQGWGGGNVDVDNNFISQHAKLPVVLP